MKQHGQDMEAHGSKGYTADIVSDCVSLVGLLSVFQRRVNVLLSSHTNNKDMLTYEQVWA